MTSRSRIRDMRTSETERERVADFLRDRCAEGRLTADELSERLQSVWSSRTYGELEWLVADLPDGRSALPGALPARRRARTPAMRPVGAVVLIVAAVAVLVHALPVVLALVLVPVALVAVLFAFAMVAVAVAPALLVLAPLAWIVHRVLRHRAGAPSWGHGPYRRF